MKVTKIELVWLVTSDLKKSNKFFTETLGLKIHESCEEYGWLEVQGSEGGTLLGIAQDSDKELVKAGKMLL